MKKLLRKKYLPFYFLVIVSIFIVISSFFLLPELKSVAFVNFKIVNVEPIDGLLTVVCEGSEEISNYIVTVKDLNDNILLEQSSQNKRIDISSLHLNYGETVNISVTAQNDKYHKTAVNTYQYTSNNPSFNLQNSHLTTPNEAQVFQIDGEFAENTYTFLIKYQDLTIYTSSLSNTLKVPYSYLAGYNGRLTAYIENAEHQIVSEFRFYNNPTLVGDVTITSPTDNLAMVKDDVLVTYTGGEHATKFILDVYLGAKLVGSFTAEDHQVTIPAKTFKTDATYKLTLKAIYEDYVEIAKTSTINLIIDSNTKTLPVTIDYNYQNLKPNTQISLATRTEGATIKYTLNGQNPNKYGATYTGPITITEDVTLKCVAVKNKQGSSDITTYNIHVGHKQPVIYLSPSNQSKNFGVKSVGYTNERAEMNKIANYVEERLKDYGFIVYRNDPTKSMDVWINESHKYGADLHFAIHSNASTDHHSKGMEIYVDNTQSKTLSIATKIYENLYAIYPNKDATTDRGIKFAEGRLGEVRSSNLSNGILIEIAHHDYLEDAKWLVEKQKEIGYNIADSIAEYYQMR